MGPMFNTIATKITSQNICRPDLVLKNSAATHNFAITQGEITTSDHLPIIIIISTKPIIKEIRKEPNVKKTNWNEFKRKLTEKVIIQEEQINLNHNRVSKDIINNANKKWIEDINPQ